MNSGRGRWLISLHVHLYLNLTAEAHFARCSTFQALYRLSRYICECIKSGNNRNMCKVCFREFTKIKFQIFQAFHRGIIWFLIAFLCYSGHFTYRSVPKAPFLLDVFTYENDHQRITIIYEGQKCITLQTWCILNTTLI